MTDVFISYAREDLEKVRPLADAIEGAGYTVFWNRKKPADLTWRQFGGEAFDEARCVVVVWSALSTESDEVMAEAANARRRGILIPVIIEDITLPPALRSLPHADLRAWDGDPYHPRIQKCLATINRVTGTPLSKGQDPSPDKKRAAVPPAKSSPPEKSGRQRQPHPALQSGFSAKPGAMLVALAFTAALVVAFHLGFGDQRPQATSGPADVPPPATAAAKSAAVTGKDESPNNASGAAAVDGEHGKSGGRAGKADGEALVSLTNQIGMRFVLVPAGSFMMGSDESTYAKPVHRVVIEKPFYIQTTEVTQAQWMKIMDANPSAFKDCGPDCPVETLSWNGVQTYIRKLSALTGDPYRLPTEAEWEYAARSGGRKQTFAGGENLDDLGWCGENSSGRTHPAGQKMPNGLGLYDMSGNVWEWVADDWHGYHKGAPDDGRAWVDNPRGAYRVIRGGGWDDTAWHCRATTRYSLPPPARHHYLGFRLARSVAVGP